MIVKYKVVSENAKAPVYGSDSAAGADLYSTESVVVEPGLTVVVGTGIAVEIPEGYAGFVYARSGLATKKGLAPANKVGVIDADYRGEIKVALYNHSTELVAVEAGDRVAQLVITPVEKAEFQLCDKLSATARDFGGFGSTGSK